MANSNEALRIVQTSHRAALALDVDAFLLDARARNLATGTLRFYTQKLTPLLAYLESLGLQSADGVAATHLRTWLLHLQETGHNAGGVHGFYRAAKVFFTWLCAEEVMERNPMARVKPPRVPDETLIPVTVDQVRDMLAACDPKRLIGARDRAVLLCLWDSGCRAAEFIALNLEDLDMKTGALIVRCGKGRKARVTFLGARSRREVLRYLKLRGEVEPSAPLFVTDEDRRLCYTTLRAMLRRTAKHAGIAPPSLHAFRRGFALDSLRNGADVYSLQKMMGHTSLGVLQRYLRQTQADLQEVHERSGPVDRML
jgi:site-specific recombinase XerD